MKEECTLSLFGIVILVIGIIMGLMLNKVIPIDGFSKIFLSYYSLMVICLTVGIMLLVIRLINFNKEKRADRISQMSDVNEIKVKEHEG